DPCKGQVLRVQNSHFHIKCFTCKVCGCDLAQSGFFLKNGDYLCPLDFQRLHGTLCNSCGEFVEGAVVTVLGKTYHPACFVCTVCKQPFPAGDFVTFSGKECLCQRCIRPSSPTPNDVSCSGNCSGCRRDIKNGQALLALGGQWHLGCFKCKACRRVLSGEYISKDGVPYCERDYQIQFGVQCEACQKFITGKVLEAGEKHYHPCCIYVWINTYINICLTFHLSACNPYCLLLLSSTLCVPPPRSSLSWSQAKVDNEIIDYRELAAIPRVKAIYDIEHPDMISYKPVNDNSSTWDNKGIRRDRQSPAEVTLFNVLKHPVFVILSLFDL
uniref:Actin binding LIM protein 1 n=1 Tax=Cyclopterus lumpus TaxID=8103 RepID=A0A8C2Z6M5_CYCLU